MAKCTEDSRSSWRASSESTSVGIEVWNYVRRQPLMQTNLVDSTGGSVNRKLSNSGGKGGVLVAVIFWRADLYQKEALRLLSDTCFRGKVDKDLSPSTKILLQTRLLILSLNKNCRPLQKILPLPLLELRVFTCYIKSTNLTTQLDPWSLPAVVYRNYFQLFRQNYGCYRQNFTIIH